MEARSAQRTLAEVANSPTGPMAAACALSGGTLTLDAHGHQFGVELVFPEPSLNLP